LRPNFRKAAVHPPDRHGRTVLARAEPPSCMPFDSQNPHVCYQILDALKIAVFPQDQGWFEPVTIEPPEQFNELAFRATPRERIDGVTNPGLHLCKFRGSSAGEAQVVDQPVFRSAEIVLR